MRNQICPLHFLDLTGFTFDAGGAAAFFLGVPRARRSSRRTAPQCTQAAGRPSSFPCQPCFSVEATGCPAQEYRPGCYGIWFARRRSALSAGS